MSLRQTVCRDAAHSTGGRFSVRRAARTRRFAAPRGGRPSIADSKSKGKEIPLLAIFTSFDLTIRKPSDVR
jgi:hypothetical protein